jgi:hypothetical protein
MGRGISPRRYTEIGLFPPYLPYLPYLPIPVPVPAPLTNMEVKAKVTSHIRTHQQGLTLAHCYAQREHFLSPVLGCFAGFSDKNGSG